MPGSRPGPKDRRGLSSRARCLAARPSADLPTSPGSGRGRSVEDCLRSDCTSASFALRHRWTARFAHARGPEAGPTGRRIPAAPPRGRCPPTHFLLPGRRRSPAIWRARAWAPKVRTILICIPTPSCDSAQARRGQPPAIVFDSPCVRRWRLMRQVLDGTAAIL
jgi:hypothetical protein